MTDIDKVRGWVNVVYFPAGTPGLPTSIVLLHKLLDACDGIANGYTTTYQLRETARRAISECAKEISLSKHKE